MTLHNIIILIKSAFNEGKNRYYYNVHINNITMTYYDKSDVSEGIDVNKTNESKEGDVCHYWYFLDKGFKVQTYAFTDCRDLLIMSNLK